MFNNFFSKNLTVYEIMSKNLWEPEWPQITSQYSAYALCAGLVRLYTRPRARVPTCTHERTRKHAYTDKYVIVIAFSQHQWFRERASMLRYMHIACSVYESYRL
jgi:hypothetical protein